MFAGRAFVARRRACMGLKQRLKSSAKAQAPAPAEPPQGEQPSDADDLLLRSPAVRKRYGASDMWLNRRLGDGTGFPKPLYIQGIRYWKLSALLAWERAQAALPAPEPRILEHLDAAHAALAQKRAEEKRRKAEADALDIIAERGDGR